MPGAAAGSRNSVGVVRLPAGGAGLVEVDPDRQVVRRPVRPAVTEHAHVPDLVADLPDPRAGLVVPEIGQRRQQDVLRVGPAGRAVRLARRGAVADVVPGDPVIARKHAGADRRVGTGGHGRERPGQRVAVVRALAHQALEVRPVVRPCAEHVPAAAVDHVRDHDLRRSPGRAERRERPSFALLGPCVVADQRRGGGGEVGERDALGGVAGLDHAGAVGDERHALEIHPDRGV